MTKSAFITGISGMDGSYLSQYLLDQGYEVYGTIRRHSTSRSQESRLDVLNIANKVETFYADLTDRPSIERIIKHVQPDKIFNTAAMSHVRISFDVPEYTLQVNTLGVLNVLEAYRKHCPKAKFYQCSSSECFGNSIDGDGFQRETTPMNPVSVYGISKLASFKLVQHYRRAYDLFATNGILFNHTSSLRGENFVEQKIVQTAVKIKMGLTDKLVLGNVHASRDFGHSKDYVRAINMIVDHTEPDDFVVATGVTHTILDVVKMVFDRLGLDSADNNILQYDKKHERDEELNILRGDASKIKHILKWKPEYSFDEIIDEMIEHAEVLFK